MKLIDIAKKIDKSKKNEVWINTEEIGNVLGIDIPYIEQDRLKCFWIGNWCCTDTFVGYRMYFFDDEPVAFSTQSGRKSDEVFHWFSLDLATTVKHYLLSLHEDVLSIDVCDINEDIGDSFKISFNSQILNKEHITFNGEQVKIIERIKNKPYGIDTALKILFPNGNTQEVEIEELDFGFHIL